MIHFCIGLFLTSTLTSRELLAPALSITISNLLFLAEAEVKSISAMGRYSTFFEKDGKILLQDSLPYIRKVAFN